MSESEIKDALNKLPLAITYRDERYSGDGVAVAGTATTDRVTLRFEVVSGTPSIDNPLFPQGDIGLSAQRGVGNGYTVTINLPHSNAEAKAQAHPANEIDGAVCELVGDCGGPAG